MIIEQLSDMSAYELFLVIWAAIGLFLAFLWFVKHILNAGQGHTIEDMERFWGVRFRDTSVTRPRKVGKFANSFLGRFKR